MEELENRLYQLIKEKYEQTRGANGFMSFGADSELGVDYKDVKSALESLLAKKKIAILNDLNGISYTLPK